MKKLFKTAVLAIAMLTFSGIANAQKLGHVDVQVIMQMMPARDSARIVLENMQKQLERTMTETQAEYQQKLAKYQAPTTSDAEKQMLETSLINLEQVMQEFSQNAQRDLQNKEQELLAPMAAEVNAAIEKIAKEKGFIYIFDTNSLHYKGGEDITPLVKKELGIVG